MEDPIFLKCGREVYFPIIYNLYTTWERATSSALIPEARFVGQGKHQILAGWRDSFGLSGMCWVKFDNGRVVSIEMYQDEFIVEQDEGALRSLSLLFTQGFLSVYTYILIMTNELCSCVIFMNRVCWDILLRKPYINFSITKKRTLDILMSLISNVLFQLQTPIT